LEVLVTDQRADPAVLQELQAHEIEVLLAE
jgi:hypothetical protein